MEGNQFDALTRRMADGTSRRRVLKGIVGGLTGLIAGGAATRSASARTITICHATGNSQAPYASMTIDQREFNLHARHGDFVRVECCADAECPNQYGVCGSAVCQNGYCAQLPVAAGTSCDDGTYCNGEAVCDGAFTCAPGPEVACPESSNPCTANVCDEATRGCIEVNANEGQSCGGDLCAPDICQSGSCVTEPVVCTPSANTCIVTGCNAQNGQCEDVVQINQPCLTGGGQSGFCNAQAVCVPSATCTDNIKNGNETDVDCGGGTCPSCADGKMCGINADCASNHCISGVCVTCLPGQTNCGGTCVDVANDPGNCGACGSVCLGYMQPYTDVLCQNSRCGSYTCQGEHYNLDGDWTNGCEVAADPQGNHTIENAQDLGDLACQDVTQTVTGVLPSDMAIHRNPAIPGFDQMSGSAPVWYTVHATGGATCINDLSATLTMIGSGFRTCYQLLVNASSGAFSAQTNGNGIATITLPAGAYSDNTDITFQISKTCGLQVLEAPAFSLQFHL